MTKPLPQPSLWPTALWPTVLWPTSRLPTLWWRRCGYGFSALLLSLSLAWGSAPTAQALSWIDLLRGGVGVFQSVQLANMSEKQEIELGKQINSELSKKEFKLYSEKSVTDYVTRIGQRVVAKGDRPTLPYVFQVVDDKQINAFATMGGYIYITTGLLRAAENEAEVAGVLGHEAGHITAKHLIKQMSKTALQQGLITAAGLSRNTAIQLGVELAARRPSSREAEFEADRIGFRMMSGAGYAQSGMVSFMEKLAKLGGNIPTFLSTHPASQDRVRELKKQLDPAIPAGDGLDPVGYRQALQALPPAASKELRKLSS